MQLNRGCGVKGSQPPATDDRSGGRGRGRGVTRASFQQKTVTTAPPGRFVPVSEYDLPCPPQEPAASKRKTSVASAARSQSSHSGRALASLEKELCIARKQLEKDLAEMPDIEDRCMRIAHEIDGLKMRRQFRCDEGAKHKINDYIRPYYENTLLEYLIFLEDEVKHCRGQGHQWIFVRILYHVCILNWGTQRYSTDEYLQRVRQLIINWVESEMEYLAFRENWFHLEGVKQSLDCVKRLLNHCEAIYFMSIINKRKIQTWLNELQTIEDYFESGDPKKGQLDNSVGQALHQGDLKAANDLLWAEAKPDVRYRRMLGDLLDSSLEDANKLYGGQAGRSVEQAIAFLNALFLFSHDYKDSFSGIPKLEKRLFNLVSAVAHEILTRFREKKHELDPMVVTVIATFHDQEWLDDGCCKLWDEHNAIENSYESYGKINDNDINDILNVFFNNKGEGRRRYQSIKFIHDCLEKDGCEHITKRTLDRFSQAKKVIFNDEFQVINREGIDAHNKYGWGNRERGFQWDQQAIFDVLYPLKEQCLAVADCAFVLKGDNKLRWEKTFCSVMGNDVRAIVKAKVITAKHIEILNILMKYVPKLPDDNVRFQVKFAITNAISKALGSDPAAFEGTREDVDKLCQWFEKEIIGGSYREKGANGQVEAQIQRWHEIRKGQPGSLWDEDSPQDSQKASSTDDMALISEKTAQINLEPSRLSLPDLIPNEDDLYEVEELEPDEPVYAPALTVVEQPSKPQPSTASVQPSLNRKRKHEPVPSKAAVAVYRPEFPTTYSTSTMPSASASPITSIKSPPAAVVEPGYLMQRYLVVTPQSLTNDLIEGVKIVELAACEYTDKRAYHDRRYLPQWFTSKIDDGGRHLFNWLRRYCPEPGLSADLKQALKLLVMQRENGEIDRVFDAMISHQVRRGSVQDCYELFLVRDCLFKVRASLGLTVTRI